MVSYRIIHVIGFPLIFPISTLNYVGVLRNKYNQVSGISDFLRNIGGGIGISLLNNFIARQGQVHNPFFEQQLQGMIQNFVAMGESRTEASHRALAQLSAQLDLQSNVLSFANSFWVLGFLIPLPFLMRRPSPAEAKESASFICGVAAVCEGCAVH
jgi:DHA2 family multidrug resistance protein